MDKLKSFYNFIKESDIKHLNDIDNDNKTLRNIINRDIPSELWDIDMVDSYSSSRYDESVENIEDDINILKHQNIEDNIGYFDDMDDDKIKELEKDNEITENYSEEEYYELNNIFKQKEREND